MAKQHFEFVRLVESERRVGATLSSVSRSWGQDKECFLFLSPHDDDVIIGGGLMMLSALMEKVPVHVAVVTDGAMGYCTKKEKDSISDIREAETYAACKKLGVAKSNVYWMGFPDCQLHNYQGRRPARDNDPVQSHGFTGLQHSLVELLRRVRPNQIFLPTSTDLHPDHRIVHDELMISVFHATGAIWPELGKPLQEMPYVHELAVYCNFPSPPRLRITSSKRMFEKKLAAVEEFKSQKQIAKMVEALRRAGCCEYLRPVDFALYNASVYRTMFDEPLGTAHIGR